jgi:hypothetical protein
MRTRCKKCGETFDPNGFDFCDECIQVESDPLGFFIMLAALTVLSFVAGIGLLYILAWSTRR